MLYSFPLSADQHEPWTTAFQTAFVRPAIGVVRDFLEAEIALAEDSLADMERHTTFLQGFKHIYDAVHRKFVAVDPDLDSFTMQADAISQLSTTMRNVTQQYRDLVELYRACHGIQRQFDNLLTWLEKRCQEEGTHVTKVGTQMKSLYRCLEKMAFRSDNHQWSAAMVLVRPCINAMFASVSCWRFI